MKAIQAASGCQWPACARSSSEASGQDNVVAAQRHRPSNSKAKT